MDFPLPVRYLSIHGSRDTGQSPVIFGAGEMIDPKALEGIVQANPADQAQAEVAPPPPMTPTAPGEGLGGLY